jgi:hypothetical protein
LQDIGSRRKREYTSIIAWWSVFASFLALVTLKHEMFADEVQPWLWVRYEHNLLVSIQHLHYEAHPALWTILLYLVSRISSNVLLLQCTNYLLAVGCAWLILSFRSVPLLERVLIVFGVSFFFVAGVLARNYMLSGLLLIAATRCLLMNPKRHWLAMVLLALAINAHFLAIPVAVATLIWLYLLEPEMNFSGAICKFKDRGFWLSCGLIFAALVLCYLTVRPAPDIETTEDLPGATLFEYSVLCVGRIWHYFLPVAIDASSTIQKGSLALDAFRDVAITALLFALALSVLPSRRSRYFMITGSLLWSTAAMLTVRRPLLTHATLLAVIYIIALFLRREEDGLGSILPSYAAQPVLVTILSMQVFACVQFCLKEITGPFSSGEAVARWIKSAGLAQHPLISQPELAAPAVMAYTGAATVYFPGCECSRPYILYSRGWQSERSVTPEEFNALKNSTGLDPVLLSGWLLNDAESNKIGVHLAFSSPQGWAWDNETVNVYVARALPSSTQKQVSSR